MRYKTIDQITELYWDGWYQKDLSEAFKKDQGHISRLINGKCGAIDGWLCKKHNEMTINVAKINTQCSRVSQLRQRQARAKINMRTAKRVRSMYYSGDYTQWDLANQFGLNQSTVSKIVRGNIWRQLPRE